MSSSIKYKIIYSKRKTIKIAIDNNGEVIVTAPENISTEAIDNVIKKRTNWINDKLNEIKNRITLPKDSILYLGELRKVKVIIQKYLKKEFVVEHNNLFIINVRSQDNVIKVLKNYLIQEFDAIVRVKVKNYEKYFKMKPIDIKVKDVKSKWGSCTYDNKLCFNYRLIMANEEIIDYVIIHEMCHMVHKNHSKDYWNLVEKLYPIYKKCDKWLKENGYLLQILHLQP